MMSLSLADGGRATILSVTREELASPQDVYNFEVADFHTYFVASAGVWVHNKCINGSNVDKIRRFRIGRISPDNKVGKGYFGIIRRTGQRTFKSLEIHGRHHGHGVHVQANRFLLEGGAKRSLSLLKAGRRRFRLWR